MFCLSGQGSTISCELFPPYDLSNGEWELGLVDLSTYNSIPNIEKDVNDKFYYGDKGEITISEGSYEIEDLETYIRDRFKGFTLRANNNTLRAEIKCSEDIHFEKPNSLASLLGFEKKVYVKNTLHISSNPINIISVNIIRVDCNIVRGSFHNGVEGHTIHEFYPTSEPGYKILVVPSTIIYLPVNVRQVNNITVHLKDQEGKLINLRNELVTLRLHVKRRTNGSGI